jgi:hypothetical protein
MGRSGTKTRLAGLTAAATLVFGGVAACHPGEISSVDEADLVITAYDTAYAFSPGTFALPDSIVRAGDGEEDDIDRSYDQEILDAVAAQFEALGYLRVFEESAIPPDVVVFVGASSSTYNWWVPGGWWGGWGWYPGWGAWYPGWGPGYGPGYPWYPGYGGSYSTGTLFIGMIDPSIPSQGEELIGVWGGAINGLLSSSNQTTATRVLDLIDQVFEQSPYLDGTPSASE